MPCAVDRRRGANRLERVEGPARHSVLGIERIDRTVGGGLDDGAVGRLGRAGVDMVARAEAPALAAARRIVGACVAVEGADHDGRGFAFGREQRARCDRTAGAGPPDLLAVGSVQGERVAEEGEVVAEEQVPGVRIEGRQRPGLIERLEAPLRLAGLPIDGIGAEVVVGHVERAVGADGDVGFEPVDEGRVGLGVVRLELPPHGAGRATEGVEVAVTGAEVHTARVVEKRRGVDDFAGGELPLQMPVAIDGIEGAIRRTDVDRAVAVDDGRAEHSLAGMEHPWVTARVVRQHRAAAGLPRVAAKLRPRAVRVERYRVFEGGPGAWWRCRCSARCRGTRSQRDRQSQSHQCRNVHRAGPYRVGDGLSRPAVGPGRGRRPRVASSRSPLSRNGRLGAKPPGVALGDDVAGGGRGEVSAENQDRPAGVACEKITARGAGGGGIDIEVVCPVRLGALDGMVHQIAGDHRLDSPRADAHADVSRGVARASAPARSRR